MKSHAIIATVSFLFLGLSTGNAEDCKSRGDKPCTCTCDRTETFDATSTGTGTCRVEEEAENFCTLLWNRGPGPVAAKANETAISIINEDHDFPGSDHIDNSVAKEFLENERSGLQETLRRDLDYEETSVEFFNNRSPSEYTLNSLLPPLSILLTSHLPILDLQSIEPDELEGDIHGIIWKHGDYILKVMGSRGIDGTTVTGDSTGDNYELVLSYGCFSARSDRVSLMIKTPYAQAGRGRCG